MAILTLEKMKIEGGNQAARLSLKKGLDTKTVELTQALGEETFRRLFDNLFNKRNLIQNVEENRNRTRRVQTLHDEEMLSYWEPKFNFYEGLRSQLIKSNLSPSNKYVVTTRPNSHIEIWETATGRLLKKLPAPLARAPLAGATYARFTPDESALVVGPAEGRIIAINPFTEEIIYVSDFREESAKFIHFSLDGEIGITGGGFSPVTIFNAKTGALIKELGSANSGSSYSAAISPDKNWAAIGYENGAAIIWDIKAGTEVKVLPKHASRVRSLEFSRDGLTLLVATAHEGAELWQTSNWDAAPRAFPPEPENLVSSARLSPDGKYIIEGTSLYVTVIDIASGDIIDKVAGHDTRILSAEFSRDSKFFTSASLSGQVILFEKSKIEHAD